MPSNAGFTGKNPKTKSRSPIIWSSSATTPNVTSLRKREAITETSGMDSNHARLDITAVVSKQRSNKIECSIAEQTSCRSWNTHTLSLYSTRSSELRSEKPTGGRSTSCTQICSWSSTVIGQESWLSRMNLCVIRGSDLAGRSETSNSMNPKSYMSKHSRTLT